MEEWLPQNLVQKVEQGSAGKGLLKQGDSLRPLVLGNDLCDECGPAHAAHDDICEQHVDSAVMRLHDINGRLSFSGLEYQIPVLFQELSCEAEHDLVVFDEQNNPAFPTSNGSFSFGGRLLGDFMFCAGQVNLEDGPTADLAVDPDVNTPLFDD